MEDKPSVSALQRSFLTEGCDEDHLRTGESLSVVKDANKSQS